MSFAGLISGEIFTSGRLGIVVVRVKLIALASMAGTLSLLSEICVLI